MTCSFAYVTPEGNPVCLHILLKAFHTFYNTFYTRVKKLTLEYCSFAHLGSEVGVIDILMYNIYYIGLMIDNKYRGIKSVIFVCTS